VKKAANASPNRALKYERELRCWSQLEVADHIGTTAFNVSRWERGITFPSSYFRQQLCQIFEKSPQKLGFLAGGDEETTIEQDATNGHVDIPQPPDLVSENDGIHSSISVLPQSSIISLPTMLVEMQPVPAAPIWNVTYRRNPFFMGRKEVLQALHTALSTGNAAIAQPQAISGLGGIGKTQTAIEYVYQYRSEYRAILWVRAETYELLMADFASIAALLELPEKNDQDQSHAVSAVKSWLRKHTDWLMVLDNADDLDMVSQFIPETIGGHLLITTRAQSSGELAQRVPIEKLSHEEGAMLLLRRAKFLTDSDRLDNTSVYWSQAIAIAEIMDGLPLALDQAAAYIEETGCSLAGYLERYRQRRMTLLHRRGGLRSDHPEPVATTWSLSFEKVEAANPVAAELLRLCAFLHPDAIAEEILTTGMCDLTPNLHLLATDIFALDAAISDLAMFSLLRRDPEQQVLTLHRLVQVVLKEQMDEVTRHLWAQRAVQVVEQAFPVVTFTSWSRCQQCLSHALACVELIEQYHITTLSALSLLNKTGSYLRERGLYSEAERILTQVQALCEAAPAPDDVMIAVSLNNLGMLYHDQGKYTQAEPLLQRTLAIYEQVYGPEHITVAQTLSNLAENYRVQTLYSHMEPLVLRALTIRENVLGPEHPNVAQSLSQLAMLYQGQGNHAQAEPLYLRVLDIRQRVLGLEHVDTAEALNNLAYVYVSQGKYAQAEPLYQQALTFCENNLGTNHMYTAISLHNLAEVYRAQGKYAQAEQLHRRALAIREQAVGPDHHHTGRSLHCLAEIYLAQESYGLTESLALQAVDILEKALGKDHPYTGMALDTLTRLYCVQGNYTQAELLAERVLAIYQFTFAHNHEYIASSFNVLAEIAFEQKRYVQAKAHLEQALQMQQQTLRAEHPAIARTLYNLAMLYMVHGDDNQAEECFVQALHIRRQVLAPGHPDLIATSQQYTALLHKIGKSAQLFAEESNIRNNYVENVI
jgi:tetratricopeptide (TPR) repeat protein/transcriptional regulator with XRE-family HTH domain